MPGKTAGGAQQHLTVVRLTLAVKPQQRQFIALPNLTRRVLVIAVHEIFDVHPQRTGDARKVAGDLTGPAGFPLCDSAAGDADLFGEFVLGQTAIPPGGANACPISMGVLMTVSISDISNAASEIYSGLVASVTGQRLFAHASGCVWVTVHRIGTYQAGGH